MTMRTCTQRFLAIGTHSLVFLNLDIGPKMFLTYLIPQIFLRIRI